MSAPGEWLSALLKHSGLSHHCFPTRTEVLNAARQVGLSLQGNDALVAGLQLLAIEGRPVLELAAAKVRASDDADREEQLRWLRCAWLLAEHEHERSGST